jgi:hypothetical protein
LARHYRKLPSEIVKDATTFDVMVMDVMTTWENYKRDPQSENNYKTEDLEELVKRTKG